MISSLWGFCVGLMHPNWQLAIEGGQVWAKLVTYPHHNPNFMYLNQAWTIIHQLTGIFLLSGLSEKILSMMISGLMGMISCMAISSMVYIFSRSLTFSALFPVFFFLIEKKMALGANYPIMLWDVPHTYGALSLSLVILVLVLIALKKNRLSGLLLGLFPSIHIAWAFSLVLIALFLIAWNFSAFKKRFYDCVPGLLLGGAISIISFVDYQYEKIALIPSPDQLQYIQAFYQWDCHRISISMSHPSLWINCFTIIFSVFYLNTQKEISESQQFIFVAMIGSAFWGIVAAIMSYFPEYLPLTIYQLMPTRLLNINCICFIACLAGCLVNQQFRGNILIISWILFLISGKLLSFCLLSLSTALIYSGMSVFREIFQSSYLFIRSFCNQHKFGEHIHIFLLAIIHVQFMISNASHIQKFYKHTDNVLEKAQKSNGMLVTASDMMLVQARTQRPVLLYGESLDMLMYALSSGPQMNKILQDIYGISLFDPPESVIHKGGLTRYIDKDVWEKRSLDEWIALKEKYRITHVITYANYQLNLNIIAKNNHYALYEIN